ncbi:MAG TPA: EAL domain-containing protein, partial [Mycobacteriales bacterium]|nr:EAL domain-containing protein [Mycobacteriales bacterium]
HVVTTFGAMALFCLVLARVVGLVRVVEEGRERLRHQAMHDGLTGLANRTYFAQRVEEELARAGGDSQVAVLFVDLDDFKTVNDSLGHAAGDALLTVVAERLRTCVRRGDVVARLGGDEFAVLLGDVRATGEVVHVAERILGVLGAPVPIGDREVLVAASVGVALSSTSDQAPVAGDTEGLLRGADVAMYLAKSKGKGRYEFFEQQMYDEMVDRLELKADLGMALERDELEIFYQPIVDLGGGIASVEALLRWHHPQRGTVPPVQFIPLAEETGLIVPIGRWVLNQACAQAQRWQQDRHGESPLGLSVNLSVRQLHDDKLVDDVADALSASGLAPQLLTVEITESVLMSDGEATLARLDRIKRLGVQIAIDDFGTGYSSLSYLQRFPVDVIKIDRSFVSALGVADETRSSALIRSVVDLSQALQLVTVAEGIEDDCQLAALEALNCRRGQGYYFSRPVDAATATTLLRTSPGTHTPTRSAAAGARQCADHVVEVYRGASALDQVAADLDELHAALLVPVNARRPWLATWVATHPAYEPWVVVVRRPGDTGIAGAALLAARPAGAGLVVVNLGYGTSNLTVLPARSGSADALRGCRRRAAHVAEPAMVAAPRASARRGSGGVRRRRTAR